MSKTLQIALPGLLEKISATNSGQKQDKQHEIYMPNANPALAYPTPPIFHLLVLGVGVGGNANFSVRNGGNANFSAFRYQHVDIPSVKLSHWGYCPTRQPNASVFASQWNAVKSR